MALPRLQHRCAVPDCRNATTTQRAENVSFFRVPKEPQRAKLWFEAIRRQPNSRLVVCDLHFTKNYISVNQSRKRVMPTAVPTLALPPATAPVVASAPAAASAPVGPRALATYPARARGPAATFAPASSRASATAVYHAPRYHPPSAGLATEITDIPDSDSSVKHELSDDDAPIIDIFVKEETTVSQKRPHEVADPSTLSDVPIKRERQDADEASTGTPEWLSELNRLVELGNAHLEPELAKYIEAQVQLQKASLSRGKKYDENLSLFALKLYHTFPQTYKLMQNSLSLPTMVQIKRLFRPLRWEMNEQWVRLLRARFAGAAPEQRECVVMVARAPLRPALAYAAGSDRLLGLHELGSMRRAAAARSAVLLAARGVLARWHQPLACGLVGAGTPASDLRAYIQFVILQLVEVGLTVRALITDFDESFAPTGPIVKVERPYFMVNNKQIYCFYDCTQLMISFRDHFMRYNINFGGLMATWEDIEEMYEYNSTRAYPLPTGLTAEHVKPPAAGPARRRARLAVEALARPAAAALAAAVDLRVLDDTAHGTVQVVSAIANLYDTLHNKALGFGTKTLNRDKSGSGTNDIKFLNEMIARLEKMSLVDKVTGHVVADPGLLAALRASVYAAMALHERMRRAGGSALPMRAFNNDPLHEFIDRVRKRNRPATPTSHQMLVAFKRSFVFNIMKSFRTSPEDGLLEEFLSAASRVQSVPLAAPAALEPGSLVPSGRLVPVEQSLALLRLARGRRSAPLLARYLLQHCLQRHYGCELARGYCTSQQLPAGLLRYMELMAFKFAGYFREGGGWRQQRPGVLAALLQLTAEDPFEAPCACFPTYDLKIMFFRFKIRALVEFNNNRFRKSPDADFTVNIRHVDLCRDPANDV